MYRNVSDFIQEWTQESRGTASVIEAISDEKLDVAIAEDHNSLGWLGWHLATSPAFFGSLVGVNVTPAGDAAKVPEKAEDIHKAYEQMAEDFRQEAERVLTDVSLEETVEAMGGQVSRGALLRTLVNHQTHHRGQMTVLLRQAGLSVPGVMGPTKEQS
ncbi:DinB family protein [Geomicrobium sp. JSM 1781026]|uniref:DinB family protein n=1 Tax=Geomicrobium sp. JSM 1781026 TaxID=3344580 RepID=UPI0035BF1118